MTQDEISAIDLKAENNERRRRLGQTAQHAAGYNPGYSVFIRRMRLILPLVALGLAAVVFTWSAVQDTTLVPVQEKPGKDQIIGKNELLNPRFESKDDKNQPYTITAQRAIQGKEDENLVMLEKPMADMLLTSGNWIAIEASNGTFRQDSQKLLLTGDVRLFHDEGYEMKMVKLDINLENHTASTDVQIDAHGPIGTLHATGLEADANAGTLVFNGPAKLVLNRDATGGGFGGIFNE